MRVHVQFERAERAVSRVGSVGNVELGILLIRIQTRQIGRERTVCAAEFSVNVFLLVAAWTDYVFVEILSVRDGELLQHGPHLILGALRDLSRDSQERFVRFELGPQRQILPHDLPLVEVADLYGNILENTWYSGTSIENNRQEHVPFLLEIGARQLILQLGLVPEFMRMEILALNGVTREQYPILSAEERDVEDGNDFPWPMYLLGNHDRIESFGDRTRRNADIFAEFPLCAFAEHELTPELCALSLSARAAYRLATDRANVSNYTISFSVFNDRVRTTKTALFFSCFTGVFKILPKYPFVERRYQTFIHQFLPLTEKPALIPVF